MSFYIGIDIGTTGVKTLLINESGNILASSMHEYPLSTPKPGWAEQDPEDWWNATVLSLQDITAKSGIRTDQVAGIGLSGQMHGSVFLDDSGNVIRPAILWCDQRTEKECAYITETIGPEKLIERTCNPALTGFTAPKIIWLRNNEPENFEKVRKALLPKDYIRYKLTGEFATEVSDASGTLLFDVTNRQWADDVIENLRLDRSLMPECFESVIVSGKTCQLSTGQTGLPAGIPVVGGGGDQAAGAVGNGIVRQGIISAALGTSGVVFAFSDEPVRDRGGRLHTFCHAVPDTWHVMGVMLAAGGSYRWLRDTLCGEEISIAEERKTDPYKVMCERAQTAPPCSEGLLFLPYLTGERTPHADPHAKGAFIGLSIRHKKEHIIRAVMEGITFGMNDSLELIRGLNVPVTQIRLSGGGAKSEFWRQMQTDIYNSSCAAINSDEGPAFGAALLAAAGTGCFTSVLEACEKTIEVINTYTPQKELTELYGRVYIQYRSLYPILKDTFRSLSGLIG